MLNVILHGQATTRPALVIAHGLFGSARNWGAIAKRLSDDRLVIVPDMRNHGGSPWFDSHGYADLARDLRRRGAERRLPAGRSVPRNDALDRGAVWRRP